MARATIALVGLALLGMVTSAAAHAPHALSAADAASAGALAATAPNPREAGAKARVAATTMAVAVAPAALPVTPVVVAVAPPAHPAPVAAPPLRAPSGPPASLRLAAARPPAVAAAPLPAAARAVEAALNELGKPYRYGALGPSTFDCSGLTKFAYGSAGITLPHSAAAQYQSGRRVNRNQLQPGDLIFWRGLDHVGMYIGNGKMVHAPRTGEVVTIISIDEGVYLGAVRPGT
ncbi:MAG TPA: C40 family peptidase [Actinomycetota bacterium]